MEIRTTQAEKSARGQVTAKIGFGAVLPVCNRDERAAMRQESFFPGFASLRALRLRPIGLRSVRTEFVVAGSFRARR